MKVHINPETGDCIRQEENWKDYFFVNVSSEVLHIIPKMLEALPWYFVKFKYVPWTMNTLYVAVPLWPFFWLWDKTIQGYFYPARLAFRLNLVDVPEGVALTWNWFRYLKIWINLKDKWKN